jgi:hypothetical protein
MASKRIIPAKKVGVIFSHRLNKDVTVYAKKGESPSDAIARVTRTHNSSSK